MNMIDYLKWRGDIPISKSFAFNEIDALILARFSYLPFDKINIKDNEKVEDICKRLITLDNRDFSHKEDRNLIEELIISNRFKDLLVSDYIKNNNKEVEKQFTGITIHLSNSELFISYVGTDNSIFGWKEDFNMAFMDNVPCQESGLTYLNNIYHNYPNKNIIIGGHSKGGNIALYSAVCTPHNIQDKIIKVYNFDGPGLNKSILDKNHNDITSKIETFIPGGSIIGRLLIHNEKITICESREKGILEHDIYSWELFKDKLIKLDKNTKQSEYINSAVTTWLKETTKEQRQIFIDTIFEVLNSSEVDYFVEIISSITVTMPKILKKYNALSEEEKKTITEMTKKFITSYFSALLNKKRK